MRIRKVIARSFGPFAGRTLELAEGMTVIVGLNEAGKSSWHAAIYAALCGMRRGKGKPKKEDSEFSQRYAPWDRDEWEVACVLDLPDGRRVELQHDLSDRVGSSARDLDLGTDVTPEIIHDGAPDGSRWLGLERRAFLAVASIRQGQILSITEHAGALQEYLQRAAATAGTDETAVAALNTIETYSRQHVGTEHPNSQKPLMAAIRRRERAKSVNDEAVVQHQDWLHRREQVGQLQAQAADARAHAQAIEARHAQLSARQLDRRFIEAQELVALHPTPPPDWREDAQLVQSVAEALHGWANRPHPEPLSGATARELEERLNDLPAPPEGDLEPAPAVRSAHRALLDARAWYDAHLRMEPPEESMSPVDAATTESELVDLARELEASIPQVDPQINEDVERLRVAPIRSRNRRRQVGFGLAMGALAAVVLGGGLLASGSTVAGILALGIGVVLGLGSTFMLRTKTEGDGKVLQAAEARLLIAEQLAATARERQQGAAARAAALGLNPDPAELRRTADELSRRRRAGEERESWQEEQRSLADAVAEATRVLAGALNDRGVRVEPNVTALEIEDNVALYEDDCQRRREAAASARERLGLEQALEARRRAETQLAEDEDQLKRVRRALRDVAESAGVIDDPLTESISEEELVSRLRGWQESHEQRRDEAEKARTEWSRLQALLDGGTLGELEARADAALARADELKAYLDDDRVSSEDLGEKPEVVVREARERAEGLERELAAAQRELEVRAERSLTVAEAEERLADAEEELERVRSLAKVLDTAKGFLAEAQKRVHHDIAPVLASKVRDRLARVTEGRYVEVSVDPESLSVQVQDARGRWRKAEFLSHGTSEQVYLLLRVAVAEILTPEDVSCPLLFDDSTVQSDPQRTLAILDLLHEVSEEHQVIVFSQENEVVAWAQEHLGDRDSLIAMDVEALAPPSR